MSKVGTTDIAGIMLGSTEIVKAYLGSDIVYQKSKPSYEDQYLTFVALEDGTISFNIWQSMGTDMIASISYSKDNGETWTTINNTDNKDKPLVINVNVSNGDKVMWKGIATQLGCFDEIYEDNVGSFFSSDCEFDAEGNIMSLLYGDDFKGKTTIEKYHTFCRLFSDYDGNKTCGVVNAKNLSLPATTLASDCYFCMFQGCTSLVTAPALPATTLVDSCYQNMFRDCTSLVTAPELPATTLAIYCYHSMFYGCTSLVTAPSVLPATTLISACYQSMFYDCTSLTTIPKLPATTLADYCYYYMFYGCTSLTTVPQLPATTLASSCYRGMFQSCTSLITAPELPAATLAKNCYYNMFYGCGKLNYIKAMFTTTPSGSSPNYYTKNWVSGVASSGTFIKNSAAQWNVSGVHGIPTGWTVETASS